MLVTFRVNNQITSIITRKVDKLLIAEATLCILGAYMPKNANADESVIHLATSKGTSFRTTIPDFIVRQFGINKGDKFKWHISVNESGEQYLKVILIDDGGLNVKK